MRDNWQNTASALRLEACAALEEDIALFKRWKATRQPCEFNNTLFIWCPCIGSAALARRRPRRRRGQYELFSISISPLTETLGDSSSAIEIVFMNTPLHPHYPHHHHPPSLNVYKIADITLICALLTVVLQPANSTTSLVAFWGIQIARLPLLIYY